MPVTATGKRTAKKARSISKAGQSPECLDAFQFNQISKGTVTFNSQDLMLQADYWLEMWADLCKKKSQARKAKEEIFQYLVWLIR